MVSARSDDDIWRLEPRRPRSAPGLYRLYRGHEPQGPADGDPGQDREGLRHGRVRRGAEHHPPAEKDGHDLAQGVPRPLQAAASPTSRWITSNT